MAITGSNLAVCSINSPIGRCVEVDFAVGSSWQTSLMLTTPSAACPFCSLPLARIVDSDAMAVAVHDAFPVAPGHTLVIPLRHVGSFFPRHAADVPDPRGGVRWVIPDTASYWD
jgi:hypothetical protein